MLMWWQYIVPFVGSLIVALLTVWFATWWSAKRDYVKALRNLRAEVVTNITASSKICAWATQNVELLGSARMLVRSCPRLYDSAYIVIKGVMVTSDYSITVKLEGLYLDIVVANNLLRTMDELSWETSGSVGHKKQRKLDVLREIRGYVGEGILPQLEDARGMLDKKLKLSSSTEEQNAKTKNERRGRHAR